MEYLCGEGLYIYIEREIVYIVVVSMWHVKTQVEKVGSLRKLRKSFEKQLCWAGTKKYWYVNITFLVACQYYY